MQNPLRYAGLLAATFVTLAIAQPAAHAADTPTSLAGAKMITADEAAKLQASGTMMVDVRVAAEYGEGHIKGAVSVPYRERSEKAVGFDAAQDEFAIAKLGANKALPIVIYCNGPECWKSYKASVVAVKAGYTGILWFREGFPAWKAKSLPAE
jgi:rhodanese-related sulfurtransferase